MSNYFTLVSHHIQDQGQRDEFYQEVQFPNRNLSIGWGEVNHFGKDYDKIKHDIDLQYPVFKGTNNPDNGGKSLSMFCSLQPGDIVFVRGNAKIIDVVVITGAPSYDYNQGDYKTNNYCTKIPFVPLFEDTRMRILTIDIPADIREQVLFEGGKACNEKN